MRIITKTTVSKYYTQVFEMFNEDLFIKLTPPAPPVVINQFDGIEVGDKYSLRVGALGQGFNWKGHITENKILENECYFTDVGLDLPFPLTFWKHCHRVIKISDSKSILVDDVTYECKNKMLELGLYSLIYSQLMYRKPLYKILLR